MFVFIPAYTPEYAPVEKVFGIIKAKLRKISSCKSINWNKEVRKHVIKTLMESVPKSHLISVWRNFIKNLKRSINNLTKIIKNKKLNECQLRILFQYILKAIVV